MVKVRLNHSVRRCSHNGVVYYPGQVFEVTPEAVTAYMTVIAEVKYNAPQAVVKSPPIVESQPETVDVEKPKRARKPKATLE